MLRKQSFRKVSSQAEPGTESNVDLNPVRARIASTREGSRFTSVFERVAEHRERAWLQGIRIARDVFQGRV